MYHVPLLNNQRCGCLSQCTRPKVYQEDVQLLGRNCCIDTAVNATGVDL